LTLVEIICAIGFLSIFTTSLLAIATKSFQLGRRQVDMAAAYQYGEAQMERYTRVARDPAGWALMTSVPAPTFPQQGDAEGELHDDLRFVYTVKVESLDSDLRLVTVVIYRAGAGSAAQGVAAIDRLAPRAGELLRFTDLFQQEVNGG
jgi:type II secretory pathway pseudopilin PulG